MNITILTIGSRGDVQPFVALGVGLKEAGHEVTLATGKAFEAFVTEHGLRHVALEVDLLERLQSPEGKAALGWRAQQVQLRGVLTLANCTVPSHDKPLAQGDSEATADLLIGERARRSRPANPKADLLQFPRGFAPLRLGRLDFRNGVLVLG